MYQVSVITKEVEEVRTVTKPVAVQMQFTLEQLDFLRHMWGGGNLTQMIRNYKACKEFRDGRIVLTPKQESKLKEVGDEIFKMLTHADELVNSEQSST